MGDAKIRKTLGCTKQEMVEFNIQREWNKAKSMTVCLSRTDFVTFRNMLRRVQKKRVIERIEVQENLNLFFSKITSKCKNLHTPGI